MQIQDYSTPSRMKTVKQSGSNLVISEKVAEGYQDVPIAKPFLFDFLSLKHGWMTFSKGIGVDFKEMRNGDEAWTPEEAEEKKALGLAYCFRCFVSSAEINGLRELQVWTPEMIRAILNLHTRYKSYAAAANGEIPIVRHVVDETGQHEFQIGDFRTRPAAFGTAINMAPVFNTTAEPQPEPEPHPNVTKLNPNDLLEKLRIRAEKTRQAVDPVF